jgi:hypothetical protein
MKVSYLYLAATKVAIATFVPNIPRMQAYGVPISVDPVEISSTIYANVLPDGALEVCVTDIEDVTVFWEFTYKGDYFMLWDSDGEY